ncbi:3-dehydroquinate dehydratase I [Dissulfuribacter thermophilus]|uniref:3-dehydroquinate dehydratase n=1 Tax=Dissulfuribacter thermophilus TaxID=1156395 RepID=A0A1B9F6M9_9BACT|nr:3-dehydroquinate dehydratase I [Dissulfuribacter thermophilus]
MEKVRSLSGISDLIEVRLDGLASKDFSLESHHVHALKEAGGSLPLLFTNRRLAEGGHFQADDPRRIEWLHQCVENGGDLIDVELMTPESLRQDLIIQAKKHGVKSVVSYHDFNETPPREKLSEILAEALETDCDIVKIVTTARNPMDLLATLSLYEEAIDSGIKLIAFSMGPLGSITRIFSLILGAPFTYCAPKRESATAPGQMDISTMRTLLEEFFPL